MSRFFMDFGELSYTIHVIVEEEGIYCNRMAPEL